jgi:sporulation protein YlmC with PRC-barrel domain
MKTLHSLSIVTAWGLASAVPALAQTAADTPTETASNPQTTGADHSVPTRLADAGSVSGAQASKLVGMKVQTTSGDSLGQIKDVVIDKSGQASYAVIAYGATAGKQTAVPWAAVSPMIQGDKVVMDQAQLEQAPVLSKGQKMDPSIGTWSRDANVYWRSVKMRTVDAPSSSAPDTIPPK